MSKSPALVQIDFPFSGPFGAEAENAMSDLARSIAQEPGFLWKIWTENSVSKEAGGVYLFTDLVSAEAYIKKHTARLAQFGVREPRSRIFQVNLGLTRLTHGPM